MRTEKTGQLPLPSFDRWLFSLAVQNKTLSCAVSSIHSGKQSPAEQQDWGGGDFPSASIDRLIQEERFADVLDFWNRAFQIKRLGQDDFENLLHIDAVACAAEDQAGAHGFGKSSGLPCCQHCCHCTKRGKVYLIAYLLLIFSGEIDKMVIFRANQERNCRLVEAPSLPVPFFDTVQGGFTCEVEHEEDGNGVVTD